MNKTKIISLCLAAALTVGNVQPVWAEETSSIEQTEAQQVNVENPVYKEQTDFTEWSYVYFGRYPQKRLTRTDGLTDKVVTAIYNKNGDANVEGKKIRRVQINLGRTDQKPKYRYYLWQPVKWKVLKNDGKQLLLLSDMALAEYDENGAADMGWAGSGLRSFLNGYGSIENCSHRDYTTKGSNFIGSAFTTEEQAALMPLTVSAYKYEINGVSYESAEKSDRIIIPQFSDMGDTTYGFSNRTSAQGEWLPSATRKIKSSEYANWEEYDTSESQQMRLSDGATAMDTGSTSHGMAGNAWVCPMIQIPLSAAGWSKQEPQGNMGISIEKAQITFGANEMVYDGTAKHPDVTVTLGTEILQPENYVLTFENDVNAGNGIVTVEGIGDYTGKCTANYVIQKAPQVIQTPENIMKTYGDAEFPLEVQHTVGDGTFSYQTSNAEVASVDEKGIVTIKNPGSAELTVTAAENENYAATSKKIPITVGKLTPKIETTASMTTSLSKKELFWTPFLREGQGILTYASQNESIASIDANGKITLHGAGTVRLTATVAESALYQAQTMETELTVTKGTQKITVEPEHKIKFDSGKEVALAVTQTEGDGQIAYQSSNPEVAFIDAQGKIIMNAIGETTITVIAKASQNYEEASTTMHLVIERPEQQLTYEKVQKIPLVKNQAANIQFTQTVGNGTLQFTSSNSEVVSVSADNQLIMHKCGKTTIHVTAAENESYTKAEAEFELTITKGNQLITVAAPTIEKAYGDKPFSLGAACTTGQLTSRSSNEKVIQINKGKAVIVGTGTAEVTISTPETTQYLAASQKVVINVGKGEQKISSVKDKSVGYIKDGQVLKKMKLLQGDGKIKITSSDSKVAEVRKGNLYMNGCGTSVITIEVTETKHYKPLSATMNLTITKTDPQEVLKNPIVKPYKSKSFFIGISGKKKNVTYKTDNKNVAKIDRNGLITVKNYGTTNLSVITKESDICKEANVTTTITVIPRKIKKLELKNKKKGTLDISWKQNKTVQGYVLAYTDGTQKKTIKIRKNDVTSKRISGLKSGVTYTVTVQAYVVVDGKKLYGNPVTMKKKISSKKAKPQKPSGTKKPSSTKKPSGKKKPSGTKKPTTAKKPSGTKKPSSTKKPSGKKKPTTAKKPSGTKKPTTAKKPSGTKKPTTPKAEQSPNQQ